MSDYPDAAALDGVAEAAQTSCAHEAILDSLAGLLQRRRAEARGHLALIKAELTKCAGRSADGLDRARGRLRGMLGWPASSGSDEGACHEIVDTVDLGLSWARTWRIEFDVAAGYRSYALVLAPAEDVAARPLLVIQHGGWGTPEVVVGLMGADNYNGVARRAVAQGWIVVLPQLLTWQQKIHPVISQSRIDLDLRQVGGSRAALDLLTLQRAAELATARFAVDPDRWAIAGLSYGGFYALLAGALDERFKAVMSSCYVNDRIRYNWSDWVWQDGASLWDDALLALLVCPRPLWLEAGVRDEIFDINTARPVMREMEAAYRRLGAADQLRLHEFDGGHEFCPDFGGLKFLAAHLRPSVHA